MAFSLHALLAESVDYAGMFPPCSLDLDAALKNQAQYVTSADSWMLSTIVLPIAQFSAVSSHLSQFDRKHPLRVSALGPKTENVEGFRAALKEVVAKIRELSSDDAHRVAV